MAWFDFLRWGRKSGGTIDILRELSARFRSKSGKTVNVETAIAVSTVFACARVKGNGMAQVPFKLMRAAPGGKSRIEARDHPLYSLMGTKPNPWQTSFEFREMLSWHLDLCGRAYVFVNRSVTGRILELIPFEPGSVTVKRADDRTLTYSVRAQNGSAQDFPEASIWHLRGPSWNGWEGLDVLKAAREAIGLAMVTEESQAALHREGVRPSGLYSVDGKLTKEQYEKLREWIDREHAGAGKDGKAMIMDGAAKWMTTQMTGVDSQHLETRREQIAEVCRFFGVMPIMVGYSDKAATFASAEAMFLAHVVHCLSPMWTRFEQSADAYLLTEKERADGLYFDFVEEGMIRGSVKDTKDALLGYVNGGLLTPNEGRGKLDMNPDPDPASDKLRIPVNVAQEPKDKPVGGEADLMEG